MGCCKSKQVVDEDVQRELNCRVTSEGRKCTDMLCCAFFAVFWVGMVIVAAVGLSNGEPEALLYARDYQGRVCGGSEHPGARASNCSASSPCRHVYYPRLNEDLLQAAMNAPSSGLDYTSMALTGVCLPRCPRSGDVVCLYDYQNTNGLPSWSSVAQCSSVSYRLLNSALCSSCWTVDLNTTNVLYRCFWKIEKDQSVRERCTSPEGADPSSTDCRTKERVVTTTSREPAGDNPVAEQMNSAGEMVSYIVGDLRKSVAVILVAGGLLALVLGFGYIWFLKLFAGCMVYLTVFLIIAVSALVTLLSYYKAGIITDALSEALTSNGSLLANATALGLNLNGTVLSTFSAIESQLPESFRPSEERAKYWEYFAYFMTAVTVLIMLIALAARQKLRIAVGLIKESSNAIGRMPLVMFFPVFGVVAVLLLCVYFVIIGSYIASADAAKVSATVNSSVPTSLSQDNIMRGLMAYHFFGFLWTNAFLQAITMTTVAGAIAKYYWTRPDASGSRDIGGWPVRDALWRTVRFHLGSLAFGAFIIAVVQFIRAVLAYLDSRTKELQNKNRLLKIIFKVVQCCLWCFEKIIKYISRNAYIMVAMRGKSFCPAAFSATKLIISNLGTFSVVGVITGVLLILGKLVIMGICGIIAYLWVSQASDFQEGGESELNAVAVPIILAAGLAYVVGSGFLAVYDLAIDTILLCFCEDVRVNEASGTTFMGQSLRDAMDYKGKVVTREQMEERLRGKSGADLLTPKQPAAAAPASATTEVSSF